MKPHRKAVTRREMYETRLSAQVWETLTKLAQVALVALGPAKAAWLLIRVLPLRGNVAWIWWEALGALVDGERDGDRGDVWTRLWNKIVLPEVLCLIGHDHKALRAELAKRLGPKGGR